MTTTGSYRITVLPLMCIAVPQSFSKPTSISAFELDDLRVHIATRIKVECKEKVQEASSFAEINSSFFKGVGSDTIESR